jgi:hypothetical protein
VGESFFAVGGPWTRCSALWLTGIGEGGEAWLLGVELFWRPAFRGVYGAGESRKSNDEWMMDATPFLVADLFSLCNFGHNRLIFSDIVPHL